MAAGQARWRPEALRRRRRPPRRLDRAAAQANRSPATWVSAPAAWDGSLVEVGDALRVRPPDEVAEHIQSDLLLPRRPLPAGYSEIDQDAVHESAVGEASLIRAKR